MTVLLDTSVLIDHLRGDPRAVELLDELVIADEAVWAATPTRTELLAGIRAREREVLARLFAALAWVDITTAIADDAGELAHRYGRSHPGIDTADYLIAGAARSIGARLLTLNVRDFPMFPGLKSPYR
ncbi:MAG: type II toxin-antitoxin system VapC family toxin [Chloroflexota bacterium]|nr:type II toxin-antitoxin system VapC family toxin [Chloroflexota bacterium]